MRAAVFRGIRPACYSVQ